MKSLISKATLLFSVLIFHISGIALAAVESGTVIEEQLETAYELHISGNEQASLTIYTDILSNDDDNLEALWNASILHSKKGYRATSDDVAESEYEKALNLARKAVELYPDSGHAYYALAVGIGRMSLLEGPANKVRASRDIKENIEKAIERVPNFAPVWHLYGVWHSDIANLNGAIKAAATLFGGIPDASNEKAEEYLSKAITLDSDNILFRLDFAKHYRKVGQPEKARELLEAILATEPQMKDDPIYIQEAGEMLHEIGV
jgi:tetratricopeptide (TPR) repeat protein